MTDPTSPGIPSMPGDSTPTTEIVERASLSAHAVMPLMSDDEIARTYRVAQALAASNLYKDVRSAEQAFAKLLIGRTLGLSEAQSLSLYAMEGKIEVPYPMLGNFVRSRTGYDYRPAWIKQDPDGTRVAVYCDEDTATDLRDIVGASIEFTADGGLRGVSTWTIEDSERAGLTANRGTKTSNHKLYPRNLFLARAMSNGVKWFMPEVLAGLPVYVEGEIERVPNVSEGSGDGSEPAWAIPVAAQAVVEKVIRRARRLGHVGLADRATIKLALNGQPDSQIREWIQRATNELDALATEEQDVKDADVVTDADEPMPATAPGGVDGFDAEESSIIDAIEDARDRDDEQALAAAEGELAALRDRDEQTQLRVGGQ